MFLGRNYNKFLPVVRKRLYHLLHSHSVYLFHRSLPLSAFCTTLGGMNGYYLVTYRINILFIKSYTMRVSILQPLKHFAHFQKGWTLFLKLYGQLNGIIVLF